MNYMGQTYGAKIVRKLYLMRVRRSFYNNEEKNKEIRDFLPGCD